MKIHDLSAQHIFPSKRYTTSECTPELVATVPSARSTIIIIIVMSFVVRRYNIKHYKTNIVKKIKTVNSLTL